MICAAKCDSHSWPRALRAHWQGHWSTNPRVPMDEQVKQHTVAAWVLGCSTPPPDFAVAVLADTPDEGGLLVFGRWGHSGVMDK